MPPRPTHVVDACAAIAYLKGEPGQDNLRQILTDERNSVAIHSVNLCEVYYDFLRSDGVAVADVAHGSLAGVLTILNDGEQGFLKRVARWKVGHVCGGHCLGIADAYAAATAEEYACPLVTTDHNDFDPVAQAGVLAIIWLR
jgi:predicted nucleic acid-binding protein